MHARTTMMLVTLLSAATVATAGAQQTTKPAPQRPAKSAVQQPVQRQAPAKKTAQQPAISRDSARAIVLKSMPDAKVRSEKLRREKGKLVYAFRLTPAGKTHSVWMDVDANNGTVSKAHQHTASTQHATAKKKA
ncbi:MAG TPA: PepSY domain-containing protein [Gemmatimonadaceae bacterium]|nr:PepSY domain-containing protein [Gemmatimonadaceae bacterium]